MPGSETFGPKWDKGNLSDPGQIMKQGFRGQADYVPLPARGYLSSMDYVAHHAVSACLLAAGVSFNGEYAGHNSKPP